MPVEEQRSSRLILQVKYLGVSSEILNSLLCRVFCKIGVVLIDTFLPHKQRERKKKSEYSGQLQCNLEDYTLLLNVFLF